MKSGSTKRKPTKYQLGELTDKEQIFIKSYPGHWNGTRAAREAGYASPDVAAAKLLKRPVVQAAIAHEKQKLLEKIGINSYEVLFQVWCMATVNGGDFTDESGKIITDMNELSLRAKNCIAGIEQTLTTTTTEDGTVSERLTTKLRLTNKNDAAKLLMQHKGLFEKTIEQIKGAGTIDWEGMYGRPEGALEPDVIEVEPKRLESE